MSVTILSKLWTNTQKVKRETVKYNIINFGCIRINCKGLGLTFLCCPTCYIDHFLNWQRKLVLCFLPMLSPCGLFRRSKRSIRNEGKTPLHWVEQPVSQQQIVRRLIANNFNHQLIVCHLYGNVDKNLFNPSFLIWEIAYLSCFT